MTLLNKPPDIASPFRNFENILYLASTLEHFDGVKRSGRILYKRHIHQTLMSFNSMDTHLSAVEQNEFPPDEYEASPLLPFSIEFISDRSIRIKIHSTQQMPVAVREDDVMLTGEYARNDASRLWKYSKTEEGHKYTGPSGAVVIHEDPWRIEILDKKGTTLCNTVHQADNDTTFTPLIPFGWLRRASDYSRSFSAAFSLHPGEKIFGYGEFYTGFDRRGQEIQLFTDDARGSQNEKSHKPVPFFMSNRGYGMFVHTSAPVCCDVGKYYSGLHSIFTGDDELDLFIFIGTPKDILNEYTNLTGKAGMPPLWSFGFWMSRITYFSEEEGRETAKKLREHKLPSDVIHFDSGWFEKDIRCDYEFSSSNFRDPEKMIADLREDGFRVSLWQLPYFVPKNKWYREILEKGLYVKDGKGNPPYEDVILDFTNPEAVAWLQEKLARLLKMGVSAIKADFGEAAPVNGIYHNGRSGFYEHNLYPTRYNKAVAGVTEEVTGEHIIWARSGWAGSQRYPVHWGGDACTSDTGMAGVLRGGLSAGLSGFSFWSHDVGGFVAQTPEDLYLRWAAFGAFSSHMRSHGQPPKEPYAYSAGGLNTFRKILNVRYRLMPYIYAQAKHSAENGLPVMRAAFVEYPDDPGAWTLDDQYLFGEDFLVAPLFEAVTSRNVYLPGKHPWTDYQTRKTYEPGWQHIQAGELPVILLVRSGALIPHIPLAQSTQFMDWSTLELSAFPGEDDKATGRICLPMDNVLKSMTVIKTKDRLLPETDPFDKKIHFIIQ
ncbi:MAG: glycoside hydrolase family 31 protein [Bacteroidales bacterium]|nr:glycoside hydrolase family 31 protein [Bacteroidales bacterium]